jgi:hypothetical protein
MGNKACCANDKKQELSRGLPKKIKKHKKRRVTFAPNMKNFKNLKYIENITDIYILGNLIG